MVPLLRFNEYLPEAGYAGRMQMKIQAMVVHEKNGPYPKMLSKVALRLEP